MLEIIFFLMVIFIFALFSRKLENNSITSQMFLVFTGLIAGLLFFTRFDFQDSFPYILIVAELALVLVLFSDASRIGLSYTIKEHELTLRLLGVGMPLSIFAGVFLAIFLFTELSIWEAAILGVVLVPTDAALGESVFDNKKLPSKLKKALEIESGLNDGLAVPFLVLFIAWSVAEETFQPVTFFVITALQQILFSVIVGLIFGLWGGWLLLKSRQKNWITSKYLKIGLLTLAVASWLLTDQIGGSGFIAAFVGGLSAGYLLKDMANYYTDLTATEGNILVMAMFFLLGILLIQYYPYITLNVIIYAILSLTLIRIVPVALSLTGIGTNWRSKFFMGWFGPRGLASIVLILIALEEQPAFPGENTMLVTVLCTVLISVFAHGISANTLSNLYARWIKNNQNT
ncbi:cation:proton antiporter [Methanobacterium alkalithermotolerans]|uniref:Cation:proton antiporter n=1 Tax=Methanobacterium alkalithermotolerans TaxID=2731220 RepID=A0A8T8K741_9EURY|nr:cation:proton antiporter [Methanobacterium alkalithermotolerans]QUH22820.1 cation:proton antiporter [Methanobacterium alkalithermotolerans]